jgi:hypothetical protein
LSSNRYRNSENYLRQATTRRAFTAALALVAEPFSKFSQYIYISLQLCKMTDARASHINAKQGNIKDQNTIKLSSTIKQLK